MASRQKMLWLALATMMLVPSRARARGRTLLASVSRDSTPQKQTRRRAERSPQTLPVVPAPAGRHVVEVARGAVLLDGRPVRSTGGHVYVVAAPTWRRDGRAVAWIERSDGKLRLVVVPDVAAPGETLPWSLPIVASDDQIFWAGPRRVVVGPALLTPRAVASWTDS